MRLFSETGLSVGTESNDQTIREGGDMPAQGAAVEPAADNFESEIIGVHEAEADLGVTEEQGDAAAEVQEALESLVDVYQASLADGGMTQGEAAAWRTHQTYLRQQAGLSIGYGAGTESFGSLHTRIAATRAGVESLTDDLKKIWEKIVAWVKNSILAVVNFFKNIFGAAERMLKRAKALKEQSAGIKGKTAKTSEIENAKVATNLVMDNGQPKAGTEGAAYLLEVVDKGLEEWDSRVVRGLEDSVKLFEATPSADTALVFPAPGFISKDVGNDKIKAKAGEGCVAKSTDCIPGNLAIYGIFPASAGKLGDAKARDAYGRTVFFTGPFKADLKVDVKKIPVLNPDQCAEVSESMETLAEAILKFRAPSDKAAALKNRLAKACDQIKSRDKGNEADETAAMYKWLRQQAMRTSKLIDHPAVDLNSVGIKVGKYLLDQVELSIRAYGDAGKSETKPAAAAAA